MPTRPSTRAQRGSVLLFALITLTVMLISAVALVRSFNGTLFTAGNLAFKRDLLNQGERVVPTVLALMQTGALSTPSARASHAVARNYSASILASNARGIPTVLLDDDNFASVGSTANDVSVADQAVTIRYVVDRLCQTIGLDTTLGADKCTLVDNGASNTRGANNLLTAADSSSGGSGALPQRVVYRLSIRVSGPRNTQAFFQTTFSL